MNEGQISAILKSKTFSKINIKYKVLSYDEALEFIPKLKRYSKQPRLQHIVLIINTERRQTSPDVFLKPGHWFALFYNITNNSVFLFDSYGTQVDVFKQKFALLFSELWASKLQLNVIELSNIQVQDFNTTTCGDHCLYTTYNLVILGYPQDKVFTEIYKPDNLAYNDYTVRTWLLFHTGLSGPIKVRYNFLRSQTFQKE